MKQSNLSRRQFLQSCGAMTAAGMLPTTVWSAQSSMYNPLPIPPLLEATPRDGVGHYQLEVQWGKTRFFADQETATLGYNGSYLGPTLRMKHGDRVSVDVKNGLSQITTLHWHGMILPAQMDGGPHQTIAPGASWNSSYTVRQRAATLFYHAHTHGKTGAQVYYGLAGMLIIDDDESLQAGLPVEYGVDDVPVIIQDRDFSSDGQLQYLRMMPDRMMGKHGATLLVNGALSPVFKAQKSLLRLRLLNASNARFYRLAFSDGRAFQVIASDGGLLQQPRILTQLDMAPAERYEILLDVSDGRSVMLRSLTGVGNAGSGMMARMMGMDRAFDVLRIDASAVRASNIKPPTRLTRYDDWSQVAVENTRKLELEMGMMGMGGMMRGRMGGAMMRINGKAFAMDRIDFSAKKDSFEIWEISNPSPMIHPLHIHNTQFRIISRNGKRPPLHEAGYKDTAVVNRNEVVRLLVPTGPYADARHPYMYHCHILEHEDGGMMGQFVVS